MLRVISSFCGRRNGLGGRLDVGRRVGRNVSRAIGFGLVAFRGGHLVSDRSQGEFEIFLSINPFIMKKSTLVIKTDDESPWDRRRYLEIHQSFARQVRSLGLLGDLL